MKVFLVEDSPVLCERLVELIEAEGEHQVIGQADCYDEALAGISTAVPDVGIFDIKLAHGNGIDTLAAVKRRLPNLVGIVMTNHATAQHARASAEAGAAFFLDKSAEFERITEILSSLAAGTKKGHAMSLATVQSTRGSSMLTNPAVHPAADGRISVAPIQKAAGCAVSCSSCCLREVCLPCGLDGDKLGAMDELTRGKRRVAKGSVLYRSGDAFASLYAVRSGSFKSVGSSRAGEEKVTGLHLPGEVMGLDAINQRQHGYDAVALEDSEVCIIPYSQLTQLAQRMPELQAQLLRILSGDISRDQGLMLLMGAMDAEQRIAAFLLSLSRRYQKLGYAAMRFSLRMTREEVGSYLGLTLETVSRVFSRLQRNSLIAAHQKHIELKDIAALQEKVGQW